MNRPELFRLVVGWLAVVLLLVLVRARRGTPTAGLTIAYVLNLSLIHFTGAAVYLLPGFHDQDSRLTQVGFEQSFYGLLAFAAGSLIVGPLILKRRAGAETAAGDPGAPVEIGPWLPRTYLFCGLVLYGLSLTAVGTLPSLSAIVSTGQQLLVAGLVLACWKAWQEKKLLKLTGWMILSLILPASTVLTIGMLGYGVVAVLVLLTFVLGLVRSPVKILVGGAVLTYLGLSLYVSYMRDRTDIRQSVWGEQSYEDRAAQVTETLTTFEWFDPNNPRHLERIDDRLNQNFLVGAAVNRLAIIDNYAHGETLWQAALALAPRALWPEKPIEAGSGNLVTQFTGIQFEAGTSVGIGQVMEFYANFGTFGVLAGFVMMGILVSVLDTNAAHCLNTSNFEGFLLWYLPGLSLMQVGGQLVEITASALGSLIVAVLVNKLLQVARVGQALQLTPVKA